MAEYCQKAISLLKKNTITRDKPTTAILLKSFQNIMMKRCQRVILIIILTIISTIKLKLNVKKYHEAFGNKINLTKLKNFRPIKSFKECEYKNRTKEEIKITKTFFIKDYIIKNAIYDHGFYNQWLDYKKEIYEGYGYDFHFLRVRSNNWILNQLKNLLVAYYIYHQI